MAIDIDLNFAQVYWTHEELFGHRMTEAEAVGLLGQLAVGDVVEAVSRLSCMVEGVNATQPERQLQILGRLGLPDDARVEFERRLAQTGGPPRVLFFPQQMVHLMRLALRHAARREGDRFDDGRLVGTLLRLVFGVSDLFGPEIGRGTPDDVRGYMLRQLGLMSRSVQMYLFPRYYELLVRLWPRVHADGSKFEPADAFLQHTGLTLQEYFAIGFTVYTRFLNHVDQAEEPEAFALVPDDYFGQTAIDAAKWRRFLDLITRLPDQLRVDLDAEDADYGPTMYRSHTFDRTPLVEIDGGLLVPTSFASLERAVTEGVFWLLNDAAEVRGLDRRAFSGPFGQVFERFAQESIERIAALEADPPTVYRDFLYGPKKSRVLSSDATLVYPREAMFVEVVTGQPHVATLTRGDVVAFRNDLKRIVYGKAAQLRRCWRDFFVFGNLKFDGVGWETIRTVWPVLLMIEGVPMMPPIYGEVVERLQRDGWPKGAPRLALLDADELAAIEKLVEDGWTVSRIIRTWKREAPDLPLSNWISLSPAVPDAIGHGTWHKESFERMTDDITQLVFGRVIKVSDL